MAAGVLTAIALSAVAVVVYAFLAKEPPTRSHLHLPGIDQLRGVISGSKPCPARLYPAGAQYSFERCTSSGQPIGWKPCSTVTYSVDPTNAPPGFQTDVTAAMADLTSATGLHLTPAAPSAQISISWDRSLFNPEPGTSGEAGVTDYQTVTDMSGSRAHSAVVRISSHLGAGGAPGVGELSVLLHELGHAVGLGHVPGPEVMNPVDRGYTSYHPGDMAGLAALYHPGSC